METLFYPGAVAAGERTLLVMLPGAHLPPSDFAAHGFVDAGVGHVIGTDLRIDHHVTLDSEIGHGDS